MLRRLFPAVLLTTVALAGVILAPPTSAATGQVSLLIPSSTAFSLLGHSCGGIQEQAFATGFAASNGYPAGDVYLQTRCGGSGRGGGYHVTTYAAWAAVTWDFTGTAQTTVRLSAAPLVSPTFTTADGRGDTLTNTLTAVNVQPSGCSVGNTTYCTYRAYLSVAAPATPTGVSVTQSGDALVVTWSAASSGGAPATTTVTAVPVGGGSTLMTSVAGSATSATLSGVAPGTTYSVTVNASNVSGTSAASIPALITTGSASTPPSAPTGVTARWSSSGTSILVKWTAADPGNSPVSDYQVSVAQYDPNGPPTLIDAGVVTSTSLTGFSNIPDWAVQVRALNATGWGPWSARVVLGGL